MAAANGVANLPTQGIAGGTGKANARVSELDGKAPESTDYANYFCTYAFLYHQVRRRLGAPNLLAAAVWASRAFSSPPTRLFGCTCCTVMACLTTQDGCAELKHWCCVVAEGHAGGPQAHRRLLPGGDAEQAPVQRQDRARCGHRQRHIGSFCRQGWCSQGVRSRGDQHGPARSQAGATQRGAHLPSTGCGSCRCASSGKTL